MKTFFCKIRKLGKNRRDSENPKENVLQRIVFKHKTQNVYLVADAYRGSKMKETIERFFRGDVSGEKLENVNWLINKTLQILGSANLVAFVGHNGLMDFKLGKSTVEKR